MGDFSGRVRLGADSARARTSSSSFAATVRHPLRSLIWSSKVMARPTDKVRAPRCGSFRPDGQASCAPERQQGTTGTFVPATKAPTPALKRAIFPLRLLVPSGKRTMIGPSRRSSAAPSSRPRKVPSALLPQAPRHTGRALRKIEAKAARVFEEKKVSPAARRDTCVAWRGGTEAARARASK